MLDKKRVMYDLERCTCHVPGACMDCSHYTGNFKDAGYECMEKLMVEALALLRDSVIIRCKDCRYWVSGVKECHNINSSMFLKVCTRNYFCADGEV